jgi:hypothetical protein
MAAIEAPLIAETVARVTASGSRARLGSRAGARLGNSCSAGLHRVACGHRAAAAWGRAGRGSASRAGVAQGAGRAQGAAGSLCARLPPPKEREAGEEREGRRGKERLGERRGKERRDCGGRENRGERDVREREKPGRRRWLGLCPGTRARGAQGLGLGDFGPLSGPVGWVFFRFFF